MVKKPLLDKIAWHCCRCCLQGVETEGEFNDLLNTLHVGDQVKLEVISAGKQHEISVNVASYDWPNVTLRPGPGASQRQQRILAEWEAGK